VPDRGEDGTRKATARLPPGSTSTSVARGAGAA
jgi:hypothetical protein